ncbi:MAG: ribonuclease HII [Deltaproteobacteria bacterium]|nr:MAG: ribonuclease HII [Deltaproteobacteria bacterium]
MKPQTDLWTYERDARSNGYRVIAGIDEAGRGPLAGPVVSACVILDPKAPLDGVTDSKKLSPQKRDQLFDIIRDRALSVGVGICDARTIDRINILQATFQSMRLAVADLDREPDFLLVDGNRPIPAVPIPQQAVVKGDGLSLSIGAASIIAKVTRDRILDAMDKDYPGYGLAGHKGYPTPAHKAAIRRLGPSPVHRMTFRGVKDVVKPPLRPGELWSC